MSTEKVTRHDDGSVTVERELIRGVRVGATDPLGDEWHAHRAAYAAEVALRNRIRQVGITQAISEEVQNMGDWDGNINTPHTMQDEYALRQKLGAETLTTDDDGQMIAARTFTVRREVVETIEVEAATVEEAEAGAAASPVELWTRDIKTEEVQA